MTARSYLEQHKQLSIAIEDQQLMIEGLRTVAEKMVQELQADRVQSSPDGRNGENVILSIADEEKWLDRLVDERAYICEEITTNLTKYATPIQTRVMLDYYIHGLTLEAIGLSHPDRRSRQWALDTRREGEKLIDQALIAHPENFTLICLTKEED